MAVYLQKLKKQYVGPDGSVVPVIDIESFSLADGEQVALIGTSGSGKTTLLHIIAGIVRPDSGRILFVPSGSGGAEPSGLPNVPPVLDYGGSQPQDGERLPPGTVNLTGLSEAQRDVFRGQHIGYIFQTHNLLPGFTALENVLLGMSFTGRAHDRPWATHLLQEVGLADRLHYRPQKLSVGQQQRVAVARALANRPQVVLADEPTGALDERNAQQVLELIRRLCDEVRASLLLVSHDLNIARQLPRVVTLSEANRAVHHDPSPVLNP
jgi:putative ABC transport system ATP-binding protein